MDKYGTARQATDDNIVLRRRFEFWLRLQTHSDYVILIALDNASHCYVYTFVAWLF